MYRFRFCYPSPSPRPAPAGFRWGKGRQSLGVLLFSPRAWFWLRGDAFSPTVLFAFFSPFGLALAFFSAEGAIRLEVYLFANLATTAAAVLSWRALLRFSRSFVDITRAAFTGNQAEINLTPIHIDRLMRTSTRSPRRGPGCRTCRSGAARPGRSDSSHYPVRRHVPDHR